ncbi:MAG TPA: hypothetical protein VFE46_02685 [Pirellulales bacterium]|nr:hypothetical protein [Pirellulales bacterium]
MSEEVRKARLPPAIVEAFKKEVANWMAKNNLTHDTRWATADEEYGNEHFEFPFPHYLCYMLNWICATSFGVGVLPI